MAEQIAHGTLIAMGDGGAPESFATTMANVTGIGWSGSVDMLDASNHDSANNTREKLAGYQDPGEMTVAFQYDPADATQSEAAAGALGVHDARSINNWRITFVEGSTLTAPAVVSAISFDAPHDDLLTGQMTLTITGAYTWA